ncbi:ComEA family DNA-binding protein [Chitinophaga qingshengii]|uniref:Helix-hairpin-helix domain-containing protein n=1 Tax=Chitinophaga qingshengii TaxID=1569794 RepID=A0ABR7TNC4_9BACT|nr:helix-hairpin-helix domain-containing protein [Chitinophaga qingshengii]MBC9931984.1 helix-hairpin-helix domain-containing protein [Chitinophaga qingshengii]
MFRNRLTGAIIGILFGFFPLINTLACVTMSFVQKRFRTGIFFLLLGGMVVWSMFRLNKIDEQRQILTAEWGPTFTRHFDSTAFSPQTLYDYKAFEQTMSGILKKTSRDLIQEHNELEHFFELDTAGELKLEYRTNGYLILAARRIHSFYWARVKEQTGEENEAAASKVPFGKSEEEKAYIAERLNIFIQSYEKYRFNFPEGGCTVLVVLGLLASFVGCVSLGRRMFDNVAVAPPVAAAEPEVTYSSSTPVIPHDRVAGYTNVNMAEENELTRIPGINLILAKAIVGERRRNGYFEDVYDLERRMGFSQDVTARLMFTTSFEVNNTNNNAAPERREEPPGREDPPNKRKDDSTGGGRRVEF